MMVMVKVKENVLDEKTFIGGAWSDNREDEVEKTKDETCLVAQAPDEIRLGINMELDEWIKDSGYSKHMTVISDFGIELVPLSLTDLKGDDLLLYDAEMELMNMILLSIPNEIYNSVDACTSAKDMWKRVERLMRGTIQNRVDRETCFTNKFDQFVTEPGEALVSVRLAKRLTVDLFDDLFDYLQQFEKLVNTSRAKKRQSEAGVILTDEQTDFLFADASRMEEIEELSANICLMARIQPANHSSNDGSSYESAFISEVQSSSIDENNEPMYPTHTKIINSTIGDDQINSNIKFDSFKGNVNSGSVDKDTHVPDLCAVENLARNAYQEAEKQRIFAKQVQTQNTHLTSQIEMYKERVRILEGINKDNNYLNEFLEADERAKRYNKQAQSQLVRDRDIIRDLEKQRDKLDLDVKNYKRKNEELQKTYSSLKRQMSEKEDTYHDTILDLEAKLKKNVDLFLKLGNSLQGMFMLGPKPLSVYDQQLKHGLGYSNPYTLKQAISKCPKLYVASSLGNLEIPLNVRDSEDILEDAFKSQQKMTEKMNDPIAVANKQSCWTINYKKLNALYEDFVPQKELSVEQKYFSSSSIPSVKIPVSKNMPSESPLIKELDKIKVGFEKLSLLIQQNCKRASIFYTSPAEIEINDFCQDQVKPILNELKVYLECFQNLFQRDIKEMKDVFESTESELDELEKQNESLSAIDSS
ncbi:hypothetical protein Tco_0790706 [Tanacetum coccineum]